MCSMAHMLHMPHEVSLLKQRYFFFTSKHSWQTYLPQKKCKNIPKNIQKPVLQCFVGSRYVQGLFGAWAWKTLQGWHPPVRCLARRHQVGLINKAHFIGVFDFIPTNMYIYNYYFILIIMYIYIHIHINIITCKNIIYIYMHTWEMMLWCLFHAYGFCCGVDGWWYDYYYFLLAILSFIITTYCFSTMAVLVALFTYTHIWSCAVHVYIYICTWVDM